jgi:hypothetical protein
MMAVSRVPLSGLERVLFRVAIILGAALVLFRVGAMIVLPYLRHSR